MTADGRRGGEDASSAGTRALLGSLALSTLGLGASMPVVPLFASTLTGSIALVGLVVAMRWVARLVLNVPAGVWCERWGAGPVFRWGSLAVVVSAAASALAPGWQVLLAARVLEGVGGALTVTAAMAIIAQRSDGATRGRQFGHLQTAQRIGFWIGPVIGGTTAARFGYRPALWVYAAVALLALGVAWFVRAGLVAPTGVARRRGAFRADAAVVLANPGFAMVGIVTFVVFFTMTGAQMTAMPFFIERVLAMGPDVVGWALFAGNAVSFVLIYPSALASDRLGRRPVILVLLAIMAAGLLWLPNARGLVDVLLASTVIGTGNTLRGPAINAYLVESVGDAPMGIALGLFRSAGDVGSALGPIAAGWLIGWGHGVFFATNAALTVAVMVAFAAGTASRAGR